MNAPVASLKPSVRDEAISILIRFGVVLPRDGVERIVASSPITGEPIAEFTMATPEQARERIDAAH
ncbi:hypothetical protein ABTN81_19770, partial [Acinetobacter baumannii]